MKRIQLSKKMKNVAKISSGTIIGQIISIITLPIITRLYNVEVIGVWTIITSFANIIQNISDLGIANALMICEKDRVSILFNIVVKITLGISCLSGGVIFLYYILLGNSLKYSLMISGLLAVYAFTLKDISIYSVVLNRNEQYDILMKNPIIRFASTAVISIGLGVLKIESGYYIGAILGQIFTLVYMNKFMPHYHKINDINLYKDTIIENKNFVKYQMPASITVTLRTELPNLLIGLLFGNTVLGYFSISQKLLTIPVTFLGQSLGTVFYQNIASMRSKGEEIGQFVARNIRRAMGISFIPMVLLAAFGDVAITLFFGLEYAIGGTICRIIVYRTLFNFISTATRGIDIVLDKQQYVLYTTLVQTIMAIVSILIGYYTFSSIYVASFLLTVSFIVVQIGYFCKMYNLMKISVKKYVMDALGMIVLIMVISIIARNGIINVINFLDIDLLKNMLKYFVI